MLSKRHLALLMMRYFHHIAREETLLKAITFLQSSIQDEQLSALNQK